MNQNNIAQGAWNSLSRVRETNPLVHCITNTVAMDLQANSLLSICASPIMSTESGEFQDLIQNCSALNLNIGTITDNQVDSLLKAIEVANQYQKPIVFDPVGSGATKFRTKLSK